LLETVLILVHPFAPFVTETIWQTLTWEGGTVLAGKQQRKVITYDKRKAAQFAEVKDVVTEVRFVLKALGVRDITLTYTGGTFLKDNATVIKRLSGLADIAKTEKGSGLALTSTTHRAWLSVDRTASQKYFTEMQAKQGQQINLIKQLKARLENDSYVKHAPHEVVEQSRHQLKEAEDLLAAYETEMRRFTITPTSVEPDKS
jgi:valyl-tRNA synthetase